MAEGNQHQPDESQNEMSKSMLRMERGGSKQDDEAKELHEIRPNELKLDEYEQNELKMDEFMMKKSKQNESELSNNSRKKLSSFPRHILIYVGLASTVTFLCGMQAAAFFGSITTIERAFHFTSTQMG